MITSASPWLFRCNWHGNRTAIASRGFVIAPEVERSIRMALARVNADIVVLDGQLIPVTPWHRTSSSPTIR